MIPAELLRPIESPQTARVLTERRLRLIAERTPPGTLLPSERDLAPMLAVSRSTLRDAIGRLRDEGLLTSERGRNGGTYTARRT